MHVPAKGDEIGGAVLHDLVDSLKEVGEVCRHDLEGTRPSPARAEESVSASARSLEQLSPASGRQLIHHGLHLLGVIPIGHQSGGVNGDYIRGPAHRPHAALVHPQ